MIRLKQTYMVSKEIDLTTSKYRKFTDIRMSPQSFGEYAGNTPSDEPTEGNLQEYTLETLRSDIECSLNHIYVGELKEVSVILSDIKAEGDEYSFHISLKGFFSRFYANEEGDISSLFKTAFLSIPIGVNLGALDEADNLLGYIPFAKKKAAAFKISKVPLRNRMFLWSGYTISTPLFANKIFFPQPPSPFGSNVNKDERKKAMSSYNLFSGDNIVVHSNQDKVFIAFDSETYEEVERVSIASLRNGSYLAEKLSLASKEEEVKDSAPNEDFVIKAEIVQDDEPPAKPVVDEVLEPIPEAAIQADEAEAEEAAEEAEVSPIEEVEDLSLDENEEAEDFPDVDGPFADLDEEDYDDEPDDKKEEEKDLFVGEISEEIRPIKSSWGKESPWDDNSKETVAGPTEDAVPNDTPSISLNTFYAGLTDADMLKFIVSKVNYEAKEGDTVANVLYSVISKFNDLGVRAAALSEDVPDSIRSAKEDFEKIMSDFSMTPAEFISSRKKAADDYAMLLYAGLMLDKLKNGDLKTLSFDEDYKDVRDYIGAMMDYDLKEKLIEDYEPDPEHPSSFGVATIMYKNWRRDNMDSPVYEIGDLALNILSKYRRNGVSIVQELVKAHPFSAFDEALMGSITALMCGRIVEKASPHIKTDFSLNDTILLLEKTFPNTFNEVQMEGVMEMMERMEDLCYFDFSDNGDMSFTSPLFYGYNPDKAASFMKLKPVSYETLLNVVIEYFQQKAGKLLEPPLSIISASGLADYIDMNLSPDFDFKEAWAAARYFEFSTLLLALYDKSTLDDKIAKADKASGVDKVVDEAYDREFSFKVSEAFYNVKNEYETDQNTETYRDYKGIMNLADDLKIAEGLIDMTKLPDVKSAIVRCKNFLLNEHPLRKLNDVTNKAVSLFMYAQMNQKMNDHLAK